MQQHIELCFVLLGTYLISFLFLYECRKMDGYKFPVYSTEFCPRYQTEWEQRSSAINCNKSNGYMCLSNENITELLEFCYLHPFIWMEEGVCLYLSKRVSRLWSYNCSNFSFGCPSVNYMSSKSFQYLTCTLIGNGCFLAEPNCSSSTRSFGESTESKDSKNGSFSRYEHFAVTLSLTLPFILIGICVFSVWCIYFKRNTPNQVQNDIENQIEQIVPLLNQEENEGYNRVANSTESTLERDTFEQWQKDIGLFVSTRACEEVENKVKSQNLVIVAGHSGYGKSTIIKHIALEYRRKGWIVKLVTEVTEIINVYSSNQFSENRTIFILEDPIGKDYLDEIAYSSWRIHEEQLKICLSKIKLLLCCRKRVLSNDKVRGLLKENSNIVDINCDHLKLTFEEKCNMWMRYASNRGVYIDVLQGIIQIDAYFPLLCKVFFDNQNYQKMGIRFFREVNAVFEEDIRYLKKTCKQKYCALVLLALYNNVICVSDGLEKYKSEEKYQRVLQRCETPKASQGTIMESLESLNGFHVKKIGDKFHFYHDLFMEVTTLVFGSEFPIDIIKYADIGILRNRVKIKKSDEQNDPHIIYLKHEHEYNELGKRLFSDFLGERLLDAILNPCLRDAKVIKAFLEELERHPDSEKIEMLLTMKKLNIQKEFYKQSNDITSSKLFFLNLEKGISPLNALIIFCHTEIIMYCLDTLQNWQIDMKGQFLFSSVCCNGSLDLFKMFSRDNAKGFLKEKWGPFYPEHTASLFHNFEILRELMSLDNKMSITSYYTADIRTSNIGRWTPLILAAISDTGDSDENYIENSNERRRNETINVLLNNKAKINICDNEGTSPLYIACQERYESTVELLLLNGADTNLLDRNKTSPLYVACQEGYENIVKLLLDYEADINLVDEEGVGPLFIACQEGYDNIVRLLLNKEADINLCDKENTSPLFVACQEGHDRIIELLLDKGANIDLPDKDGTSPLFIASQEGHESTVNLLLSRGANINLLDQDGTSPLFIACKRGYNTIVLLLLQNSANVNLCDENGTSPLHIACKKGHENTVQILLDNKANINNCNKDGVSPLHLAFKKGHDNIVQLLERNKADVNICDENGIRLPI